MYTIRNNNNNNKKKKKKKKEEYILYSAVRSEDTVALKKTWVRFPISILQ